MTVRVMTLHVVGQPDYRQGVSAVCTSVHPQEYVDVSVFTEVTGKSGS